MVASLVQPQFAEMIYFSMVPVFMLTVKRFDLRWAKKAGNISE
jgi:hypothetical protein